MTCFTVKHDLKFSNWILLMLQLLQERISRFPVLTVTLWYYAMLLVEDHTFIMLILNVIGPLVLNIAQLWECPVFLRPSLCMFVCVFAAANGCSDRATGWPWRSVSTNEYGQTASVGNIFPSVCAYVSVTIISPHYNLCPLWIIGVRDLAAPAKTTTDLFQVVFTKLGWPWTVLVQGH